MATDRKWERSNGDRPTMIGRPSSRSSESTAVVSFVSHPRIDIYVCDSIFKNFFLRL